MFRDCKGLVDFDGDIQLLSKADLKALIRELDRLEYTTTDGEIIYALCHRRSEALDRLRHL